MNLWQATFGMTLPEPLEAILAVVCVLLTLKHVWDTWKSKDLSRYTSDLAKMVILFWLGYWAVGNVFNLGALAKIGLGILGQIIVLSLIHI